MIHLPEQRLASRAGFTVQLSETKTLAQQGLPNTRDQFGSRLQLMLYYRLLCGLLSAVKPSISSPENPFSLDDVWHCLGLDPSRYFGYAFRDHIAPLRLPLVGDQRCACNCLQDIVSYWRRLMRCIRISGVEETLSLVYFRQRDFQSTGHGRPSAAAWERAQVIDTKYIYYDKALLDKYFRWMLKWWSGERATQGITHNLIQRCQCVPFCSSLADSTCSYDFRRCRFKDGCQWKERLHTGEFA